ncbi:MAG TPA: tRNA (guanosine(46)-N7)-methyltransferase TrmB, partial [Flavobacteriales bacterium]|nr:tRNA (guanosine(46)-N7)-methyltransferase TrmB [Flavobacteriales bacterium]
RVLITFFAIMGKNKLQRWAEMEGFPNVIQQSGKELLEADHPIKGHWKKGMFHNDHPITLELGCGKGEYTVGLAKRFAERNFIGVDVKGARIWRGAKTAVDESIKNAAFLRTRIDFIKAFFSKDEVDEIWLTFSDPQPREGKENKRLSSPYFLENYCSFLKPDGLIHVKTDSDLLYVFTREVINKYKLKCLVDTADLYGDQFESFDTSTRDILDIRTHYEQMWLAKGKKIKYLKFELPANFKMNPELRIELDPSLAELEKYYKTIEYKTR